MALKTTGNFYLVTFKHTNDAVWSAIGSRPPIPSGLIDYVVDGATCCIYVIDSGSGYFAFPGGQVDGYADSLLATSTAALTKQDFINTNSAGTTYAVDGTGTIYKFNEVSGMVEQMDPTSVSDFKAFLP